MDKQIVNEIRVIANEMITKAGSGHPGIALSSAPMLYTLYAKHMVTTPKENSIVRDRFVLSAGHGSAVLYATLYALGYPITKEELVSFRQLGSRTSGHPEVGFPGVDVSTGPLGQGIANAVGMAIASKHCATKYNTGHYALFDQNIYCLVGEGCLMEGIGYEALCLAGTLQLDNLIVLYDCNNMTIDGRSTQAFDIDIPSMVQSLGFEVIIVQDGNSVEEIDKAIAKAKTIKKPTMIVAHTLIGYGSLYEDNARIHGTPLTNNELIQLRQKLNVTAPSFDFSVEAKKRLEQVKKDCAQRYESRRVKLAGYKKAEKQKYLELTNQLEGKYEGVREVLDSIETKDALSSRQMNGLILQELGKKYPILCGSADLKGSTKCFIPDSATMTKEDFSGKNIMFGIREHAMSAIANGIALFGGQAVFVSTFLTFCDYMKGGMRMSAMMDLPVHYVLTHDSILVGEDGPTHQPAEQLSSLRATPNLMVFRPCNMEEAKACYLTALTTNHPTCFVGTRQTLVSVESSLDDAMRGGYVISSEGKGNLEGVIIATGSEVNLAIQAQIALLKKGYNVRVVSMPCVEVFLSQPESYRKKVLPPRVKSILTIEAGEGSSWYRFAGTTGDVMSMDTFGASGKAEQLYRHFGFTQEEVQKRMIKIIKQNHSKIYSLFE